MANGKTSFVLYTDVWHTVEKLTNDKAGILFKHILRYVNDQNPETKDIIIQIAFEPIKQSLKRDLRKYESICLRNRANGAKGGRPKKKPKKPSGIITNPKKPKKPDSDIDSDSDIDNVNEKKEIKKMPGKPADFIDKIVNCFIEEHGDYEIITPGKEREMAGKILHIYKKKYPDANSEEILIGLKAYFKMCINIQDSWLRNNMSLSIIVSKFNEINKILKNGTNKNDGATKEQLAELIARTEGTNK